MKQEQTGRQLHKNQQGFSLVEVILAMMILAVIAVPLCHSFITAAKTNAKARRQASANAVAENIMEGINAYSYEEIARQFSDEVAVADFLISHNCSVKEIIDGVNAEGDCDNTMTFRIGSVEEDVYAFDVKVTVDASAYLGGEDGVGINDRALAAITNYNASKDYLFTFDKADDIAAKQALAGRTGGAHTYTEFDGRVQRTIRLTLSKGSDYVRVSTEVIYEYIGTEGWLTGTDAVYSRNYGSMQFTGDVAEKLLRNAYICYLPLYDSTALQERDRIEIINTNNVAADFYLIKQVDSSGANHLTEENAYVPYVTLTEGQWASGRTSSYLSLHTNYDINIYIDGVDNAVTGGVGPRYTYIYADESNNPLPPKTGDTAIDYIAIGEAVATESGYRLYHVTVEVYPEGTYGSLDGTPSNDPYIILNGN